MEAKVFLILPRIVYIFLVLDFFLIYTIPFFDIFLLLLIVVLGLHIFGILAL